MFTFSKFYDYLKIRIKKILTVVNANFFLILGISTAARNGWQVHSYAQDSVAVEEIWPETTREDPRSVQCCPRAME